MMMWSRKEIRSPSLGTYPDSSYFCFSGLIGVSLPFLSLPCCAFLLLKTTSAFWPRVIPMQSMAMATERCLAGLSWSAGCFFIFQTSATSFSTDCNFLLVSLISSPNALAANSDPVCSFFFSHIDASSAVTTNLCRPSCPAPLSFYSLACLSTWVLVLQNGKPSNSRATFPCLPRNTHVELDLDPIQVHSCIQSCLRARTVSVAFSCTKGSSGKSLSLFWIFWCSWRITINLLLLIHLVISWEPWPCLDVEISRCLAIVTQISCHCKQMKSHWTLLSLVPSWSWLALWAAISLRWIVLC